LYQKGSYDPKDLTNQNYKSLIIETQTLIIKSVEKGIKDNVIPIVMEQSLKNDVFLFSALKTHAQLFDASRLLTDENGKIRSAFNFEKKVTKINNSYNTFYLDAERNFALTSAQQAANWNDVDKDGDRYNLQYRTALDEKVRNSHAVLEGTTLPVSDSFWDQYYPPNGWRCRCVATQVNKDKYPLSDSDKAIEKGKEATSLIGANGKNKLEIFRFNPGKQKVIFPPNHPYTKVSGASTVKEIINSGQLNNNLIDLNKHIKKVADRSSIKSILMDYAEKIPESFANGLETIKFSSSKSYLMQHSIGVNTITGERIGKSTISLSRHTFGIGGGFNPAQDLINGFDAIKNGEELTFNQEYSFESLWHEILHAKSKTTHTNLSSIQRQKMETVNQFVARHTYPEFMASFGGKAIHQKDILSDGYGYGSWISDFRTKLKELGIDEKEAVSFLEPHLMNDYTNLGNKIDELFRSNK
jgi:SPP1 gp7 family putative phage head morphogenesis protein